MVELSARSTLHPITSRTAGLQGYVDVTVEDATVVAEGSAEGELVFHVETIRSGNPFQDRELLRRIESRRYPTISGRLTALHPDGAPDRFRGAGELTFMGVTRPCEDTLNLALTLDGRLRIGGESVFDVRDFGMEPPRILMVRVEPAVHVRLTALAEPDEVG
jgi:hypothetical protein